ncbi:zf-HC2 domain-containing protein, partial [Pyxidicoccus fallax]
MNPQNLHAHEDRLLDFAYGELPVPEARVVEAHLQGCARCTQALRDIRGVRATMSQLSTEPAPDAGLESLLAYAQQAARRNAAGPTPKPSRWRRWLLPVVGLASVSTFGIFTLQAREPGLLKPNLGQKVQAEARLKEAPAAAPAPAPVLSAESAPKDDAFALKEAPLAQAAPQRAPDWEQSGGGGFDGSLVRSDKAKRELSKGGLERSRGAVSKPYGAAQSAPREKADRDEEALAMGVPVEPESKPSKFMGDSLKLGGMAPAAEAAPESLDETEDGLTAPEEEGAPTQVAPPPPM